MNSHYRSTRVSLAVVAVATALSLGVFVPLAVSAAPREGGKGEGRGEGAPTSRPEGGGGANDHERLEHAMESLEESYGQLREQIGDASKNESSLQLVGSMQRAVLEAKSALPGRLARMPEAERAKASVEYRGMMVELLRRTLTLEEHLIAGDNAKAAEALSAVHDMEETGHARFKPKRQRR